MSLRKKTDTILSQLEPEDRDTILSFLLECQILEYGILYLLTNAPFSNGPKLEDVSNKPLGALINELEKINDPYFVEIIEETREFNKLRKFVIHELIHSDISTKALLEEIIKKITLARKINNRIDYHFNFIYGELLDIPYGSIF